MDVRVWIDGCACGTRVVIRKKPDEKGREFFELEDMTTKDAFKYAMLLFKEYCKKTKACSLLCNIQGASFCVRAYSTT